MDIFYWVITLILTAFTALNVFSLRVIYGFAKDAGFKLAALNERATVTGIKTVGTVLLAILGYNRIFGWHWSVEPALGVLAMAVILHSLPPIIWLWYYYTGRFSRDPNMTTPNKD